MVTQLEDGVEPQLLGDTRQLRAEPSHAVAEEKEDDQARGLVHRLFLHNSRAIRHVGFVPVEPETEISELCLHIARELAWTQTQEVGLIDAVPGSTAFDQYLHGSTTSNGRAPARQIQPRLWLISAQSWLKNSSGHLAEDEDFQYLAQLSSQFEFSLFRLPAPTSWLTAKIGQICQGLVLIIAANRTRRLAALQTRDQLLNAGIDVLGSILTDRRFPVPFGLYRKL